MIINYQLVIAEREANETALALAYNSTVNMLNNLNDNVIKQTTFKKTQTIIFTSHKSLWFDTNGMKCERKSSLTSMKTVTRGQSGTERMLRERELVKSASVGY